MWKKCAAKTIGHRSKCNRSLQFQGPDPEEPGGEWDASVGLRSDPEGDGTSPFKHLALRLRKEVSLHYLSSATVARYKPSGEKHTDLRELMWTSLSSMGGWAGCGWGEGHRTVGGPGVSATLHPSVFIPRQEAKLPWPRRGSRHVLDPMWKTWGFADWVKDNWKQVHFIAPVSHGEGWRVTNTPCANFLMQSRSALTCMPQYKLKVFFRLRYMIIIGLPIICFRKQETKGKRRPSWWEHENSLWK